MGSAFTGVTWCLAAALATAALGCAPSRDVTADSLTVADRTAIHALDSAFVAGWLRDDTSAVLGLFAADAVLLPPGAHPVQGVAGIRGYWWPTDGTHTRITAFTRRIDEIEGTRTLAFARATASLSWESTGPTGRSAQTSRSTDLTLMRRDSTGRWVIARQMWNPLP